MGVETCTHCGKEFHTWEYDVLRLIPYRLAWITPSCKHCACLLRGYHRWSITDQGRKICADCFRPRWSLARLVQFSEKLRKTEKKAPIND